MFPRQRIRKQEEIMVFLCGPYPEVITRPVRAMGSVEFCKEGCDYVENSVVECYPSGNGVTTEAEESPLSRFVTRKRLLKAD
jgi:hypothetical protein